MSGYAVGPVLEVGERPFADGWEQNPTTNDGHVHVWENVLVQHHDGRFEECIRCVVCHCPRCGYASEPDPCMERRHHSVPHRYLSGRMEKVGA